MQDIANIIERVVDLSSKAIAEKDSEMFVKYLLEREGWLRKIVDEDIQPDETLLADWLSKELDILSRLEKERVKLLKEMDELSQNRKAVRQYSSKFPFPPMPAFLDRIG